jgi:hypothetical protein
MISFADANLQKAPGMSLRLKERSLVRLEHPALVVFVCTVAAVFKLVRLFGKEISVPNTDTV